MSLRALDLGPADVHVPGALGAEKKRDMAILKAKKRNALPKTDFGDPANRKYPLPDKAHADNAAARLEQEKGSMSSAKYAQIKARITAAQKRFGEKPKKKQLHVRADLADGGSLHIRHMFDGAETTIVSACPSIALSDEAVKAEGPVWNQVAKCGAWRGHPQGPFVIDMRTLTDIVRNFKATQNRDVPVDINHVSEQPPTAGTLPLEDRGAKAHIIDLEIRGSELWGLFDYSDGIRPRVRNKEFPWFSPAIRFNAIDPTTKANIGALLSSGALCTKPFLDGMVPLAATETGLVDAPRSYLMAAGPLAHAPHEYMPAVKQALKVHELSTPAECSDQLGKLRDMFDMCDGEVGMTSDGVDLASYMHPLRELVGATPGDEWDDVFETVQALIDAAIGEHEVEEHDMNDVAPATALTQSNEEPIMSMTAEEKAEFAKLQNQVSELTMQLTAAQTAATTEKTRADSAEGELRTMRDAALESEVDATIARHAKDKGYKPEHKAHLLSWLQANPEGFRAMHPIPEGGDKAKLLGGPIVPPARREDAEQVLVELNGETHGQTVSRLMNTKHMSYPAAVAQANQMHGVR